jgi:DnaJ-class molecular chaperone
VSHYETLGVAKNASKAEIKAAYRKLSRLHHPDRPSGDHAKMTAITTAYRVLSDDAMRERYDRTGLDSLRPDVRQEAEKMLASGFAQHIEAGRTDDVIQEMRDGLTSALQISERNVVTVKRRIADLEKKAKRLRRATPGEDLYASIIASKIQEQRAKIDAEEQFQKVGKACLALMDEYESTAQPPAAEARAQAYKQARSFFDL